MPSVLQPEQLPQPGGALLNAPSGTASSSGKPAIRWRSSSRRVGSAAAWRGVNPAEDGDRLVEPASLQQILDFGEGVGAGVSARPGSAGGAGSSPEASAPR